LCLCGFIFLNEKMQDILKLLPNLLRLAQNNEEVCESASFVAWRVSVGEAIARVSLPRRLARKTLVIAVMDETWKKQLEQISSQILFKLNTALGTAMVTGLEFQIDPGAVKASQPSDQFSRPEIEIDSELMASAAKIKDPELRARYLKTAGKYLQAQREPQRHKEEKE
jgi:hypothetical protein